MTGHLFRLETAWVLLALLLASRRGWPIEFWWRPMAWLGRHPALALVSIALLGALLGASLAGFRDPPVRVSDESSYLLGADTFARFRLANPTPPVAEHFETSHVLMWPAYVSIYPPAQAAMLAIGQRLWGRPIVGVWLSLGMLAAAMYPLPAWPLVP